MSPLQRYQSDIEKNRIIPDPAQLSVVKYTQSLYDELVAAATAGRKNAISRFFVRIFSAADTACSRIIPVGERWQWQDLYR